VQSTRAAAALAAALSYGPFAAAVKFTENGQRLELDDGLWHTATAKGGSGWSTWEDSLSSEARDR
jgi:hypothetical protein